MLMKPHKLAKPITKSDPETWNLHEFYVCSIKPGGSNVHNWETLLLQGQIHNVPWMVQLSEDVDQWTIRKKTCSK